MPALILLRYEVLYELSNGKTVRRTQESAHLHGVRFPDHAVSAWIRPYPLAVRNGRKRRKSKGEFGAYDGPWSIGRLMNADEIRERYIDSPARREMLAACRSSEEGLLIVMDDGIFEPFTIGDRVISWPEKRRDGKADQHRQPQPAGGQQRSS